MLWLVELEIQVAAQCLVWELEESEIHLILEKPLNLEHQIKI